MSIAQQSRVAFLVAMLAAPAIGQAQDTALGPPAEQGKETDNNWMGIVPYIPIPTYALTEQAKAQVRDLEDRQLLERRTLEDQYQREFRALLQKQADERASLLNSISSP